MPQPVRGKIVCGARVESGGSKGALLSYEDEGQDSFTELDTFFGKSLTYRCLFTSDPSNPK